MVTVITKTIGLGGPAAGYDYANFSTAESAVETIATLAFGSTDLVANDGAIVFEAVAGTYTENVTFSSTLTTDATRQVTYRPAAGSEHQGQQASGVVIEGSATSACTVMDDFTVIHGLNISNTTGLYGLWLQAEGATARSCVITGPQRGALMNQSGTSNYPCTLENCVAHAGTGHAFLTLDQRTTGVSHGRTINCTAVSHGDDALRVQAQNGAVVSHECVNMLVLSNGSAVRALGLSGGTATLTGSNNFGGATNPFPVGIQGTPATITATTDRGALFEAVDYAVYDSRTGSLANTDYNDVWQQGVGPASNSDVPTTDIRGVARSGASCNPGAFETDAYEAPSIVTITVGSGKDYATIVLAEAAISTELSPTTDLVADNKAVEIVVDGGLYDEKLTFAIGGYTFGPQNNVTLRAATSGQAAVGGVVITHGSSETGSLVYCAMDNMLISGVRLEHNGVSGNIFTAVNPGARMEDCFATTPSGAVSGFASTFCDVTQPSVVKNSVFDMGTATGLAINASNSSSGTEGGVIVVNCTSAGSTQGSYNVSSSGSDMHARFINCLALHPTLPLERSIGGGTDILFTGSNNFGVGGAKEFPLALQGAPYPVTPTTDTNPGAGDWLIYDAVTYAVINDPDNDVLAGGIGPDANSDVPTTDIVGSTRSGATTDPGAFEISTLPITIMRQIYQQDASFSVGASSAGVEKITHQLGPASADYFTINSSTSATVSVPPTAHALRIICVVAQKACDVTLDLDASNSVFLGSIGGVASVQTDLTYFWSFGQVVSDGTYPRVRIVDDGFGGDQNVYLWWHLA